MKIDILKRKRMFKEKAFIALMLFIPVSNFLVFWLFVNFNSILLAFQTPMTGGGIKWGFENFIFLWKDIGTSDSEMVSSFVNTMIFFFTNLLFVLPISLFLCFFLYKKVWGYKIFRFVFYLPSIISASILVVLFKYIIAANGPIGLLTQKLGLGIIPFLTDSNYALNTILFYSIMTGFGGNIVLLSGAMSRVDESIIEAGKIDGVGLFGELFHLVLPSIWATISTLIVFAFVGMFGASGPILLFTQGRYSTSTISYWIYGLIYYNNSYYYPAAIGLVFTVIGTPIALTVRWLLNRTVSEVET